MTQQLRYSDHRELLNARHQVCVDAARSSRRIWMAFMQFDLSLERDDRSRADAYLDVALAEIHALEDVWAEAYLVLPDQEISELQDLWFDARQRRLARFAVMAGHAKDSTASDRNVFYESYRTFAVKCRQLAQEEFPG